MGVQHSFVQQQSCTWQGMAPNDDREGDASTSPPPCIRDSCNAQTIYDEHNKYNTLIQHTLINTLSSA